MVLYLTITLYHMQEFFLFPLEMSEAKPRSNVLAMGLCQ